MSSMLSRYLHNLHLLLVLFIMYFSVLSWFTIRSLGFSISDVSCLKLIAGYLANVIRRFHINISLIFLGNEAVVEFGDLFRNA